MQATRDNHTEIRKVIFGVAQHIFNNPRTLDACKGMFDSDPNTRYLPIVPFLGPCQLTFARLFFG